MPLDNYISKQPRETTRYVLQRLTQKTDTKERRNQGGATETRTVIAGGNREESLVVSYKTEYTFITWSTHWLPGTQIHQRLLISE